MAVKIITNNPRLAEDLKEKDVDFLFLDRPAQIALLLSRDLIMEGWRLAADPLSGYNKRYNPFHTVFLTDDSDNDLASDVLRLERAAIHLNDPKRPESEKTDRIIRDYMQLDYSLAVNTLKILTNIGEKTERRQTNGNPKG